MDNTENNEAFPAPWRISTGEDGGGFIMAEDGSCVTYFTHTKRAAAEHIVAAINEEDAKKKDWLAVFGTGVKFSRFKTGSRRVLVATWRNETGEEHIYELRIEPSGDLALASFLCDGRMVFTLFATTVSDAEQLAVAAARRRLQHSHRKAVRTARRALAACEAADTDTNTDTNTNTKKED